jgi:ribonucleoside-triphosphate reductase (formate)
MNNNTNGVQQSARAQIVERRTYLRPKDKDGRVFETPAEAWRRVIDHQRWLWERAQDAKLNAAQEAELEELYWYFMDRQATVSGRTRWLGGTAIARIREASQFNCSFTDVRTVHDVVDGLWLLLQGVGLGFSGQIGILNGFAQKIDELEVIRSTKVLPKDENGLPISDPALKGCPKNQEWFDKETGVWTIRVGDSAEAWAKFFGKLLAFKRRARKLVVDLSEIRPAGYRLSGYGWISSGDTQIARAVEGVFVVLNRRIGELLTAIDMLDILNHLGTILSSRRSAEIALYTYGDPEWREFATAKKDHYLDPATQHRAMSNNSLVFDRKPSRAELQEIFDLMEASGGSEPGFINGEAARKRAPHYRGLNPCAEILLGDSSFCNLTETNLPRFNGRFDALLRAHELVARANYRQTCVDLRDGVLQDSWHELNEFLRLCGVGVTGVVGWEFEGSAHHWELLRDAAHRGVNSMADELGTPRAKLTTTIKPSGTQTKVSGLEGDELGEGVHKPLGKYILNRINFSKDDPIVAALEKANYRIEPNPYDSTGRLAVIPVVYNNVAFDRVPVTIKGRETFLEVNQETAIDQLERYKLMMTSYVDHNCSITVNYSPDEVPGMVDWLLANWDDYIGVSFLYRQDVATLVKAAEADGDVKVLSDALGFPYLPQTVVDADTYWAYANTLAPVDFSNTDSEAELELEECQTGACPIR